MGMVQLMLATLAMLPAIFIKIFLVFAIVNVTKVNDTFLVVIIVADSIRFDSLFFFFFFVPLIRLPKAEDFKKTNTHSLTSKKKRKRGIGYQFIHEIFNFTHILTVFWQKYRTEHKKKLKTNL